MFAQTAARVCEKSAVRTRAYGQLEPAGLPVCPDVQPTLPPTQIGMNDAVAEQQTPGLVVSIWQVTQQTAPAEAPPAQVAASAALSLGYRCGVDVGHRPPEAQMPPAPTQSAGIMSAGAARSGGDDPPQPDSASSAENPK